MDQDRMTPAGNYPWLESVLCVPFSAATLCWVLDS